MKVFCGDVILVLWEQYNKTFPIHKNAENKYTVIERYVVKLSVQLALPIKLKLLKAKVDHDILK